MQVDFACNDEHGHFMGRAERVTVGELELECTLLYSGVKLETLAGQQVRVGRLVLPYSHYKYGVGNWCWDGYWLADEDVVKIINYLMRQKYWSCESGPEQGYEKFNAKQPFTVEDLKELV